MTMCCIFRDLSLEFQFTKNKCDRVIKEAQVIVEKLKETQEEQEVLHLRLQDEKEKRFLEDFLELQRKEIEAIELQNRLEEEKRYNKYRQASEDANKSKTIDALRNSERIFLELGDYQDSVKRAERCAKEARLRVKRLWKKAGICCICFVAFFVIVSTFIFPIWNYNKAQQYFSTGDYEMAMLTFENLGDYKDSEKMISDCKEEIYLEANSFYETKEYKEAFSLFLKISDYKDSLEKLDLSKYNVILQYASSFATGDVHTVGLKTDGTVKATGANYYGQCNVGSWKDIVSIDADGNVTVGLKKDGTVVVTGEILSGKDEIKSWTDIVYITLYEYCIIGVKIDGTVVAVDIADSKEPFVSGFIRTITNGWINIVTVEGNEDCIIGIKDDGGIVSTATADSYSDYDKGYVVQGEIATKDFAEVTAGNLGIYILKDNGVVYKLSRQEAPAKINGWSKIKNIDAGWSHVVGITSNGTIVATGAYGDDGACDVDSWRDIVDVSAGLWYTVGLKFDGTVVATGINDVGQCNVEDWIDIMVYDR